MAKMILVGIVLWIALGVIGFNAMFLLNDDLEDEAHMMIDKIVRRSTVFKPEEHEVARKVLWYFLMIFFPIVNGPRCLYWFLEAAVKRVFK